MKPDFTAYPCCGHEHRWSPGAEKWFCTDPDCRCQANSLDELEALRQWHRAGTKGRHCDSHGRCALAGVCVVHLADSSMPRCRL